MLFHELFLDFFTECLRADGTPAIFEYNFVGIGYEHGILIILLFLLSVHRTIIDAIGIHAQIHSSKTDVCII